MLDFEADCSSTADGWFEVQGFVSGSKEIENSISQSVCSGTAGGDTPFPSVYHVAKCGYINVFHWSQEKCSILHF